MIYIGAFGEQMLRELKKQPFFPFKTGHLKFHATKGELVEEDVYCITFDGTIAPYVEYLEEGTRPHDIPNAFGKGKEFGIGGRFSGKFHPGSTKHKDFIKVKSVDYIIKRICSLYGGTQG